MKTKKKNQKPIDIDGHFKYRCPKINCGYDHWLSFKQVKIKNFRVVCDCGTVFKPKTIKKIKIVYEKDIEQQQVVQVPHKEQIVEQPKIPLDLEKQCGTILTGYGFTTEECSVLIAKAYQKNQTNSAGSLVKYIIQNLGELNEFN